MLRRRILVALALVVATSLTSVAHALTQTEEWAKRISSAQTLGALGTDLFGDSTNYYDGSTRFTVTDVDIPGNDSLPVRLTRTLDAQDLEGDEAPGLLGNWDLDLPYVSGIFSAQYGWKTSGANPYARCSDPNGYSAVALNGIGSHPWDYWRGNFLYIPGHGKHYMLLGYPSSAPHPTNGQTTALVTIDFTQTAAWPASPIRAANPASPARASSRPPRTARSTTLTG